MDKQNNEANQDNWLDEILGKQPESSELGPDETAVISAGLTHPDDLELERIVQETIAENWGEDPEPQPQPQSNDDTDSTRFFAPPQQETPKKKTQPKL